MSLQYHNKKEETIYVMSGILLLWESKEEEEFKQLGTGTVYHVKPGQVHRFGAGQSAVMLTEVSTNYLDDVIRLKDDYNR
jgi:quercetin dioxygenase-like cupin family protein